MKRLATSALCIICLATGMTAFATTTVNKDVYKKSVGWAKDYMEKRTPEYKAALNPVNGRVFFHLPYGENVQAPIDDLVGIDTDLRTKQCDLLPIPAREAEALIKDVNDRLGGKEKIAAQSCFRSMSEQVGIFCNEVRNSPTSNCLPAEKRAQVSAPPGFSEHATGYTMDLNVAKNVGTMQKPVWSWVGLNLGFEKSKAWAILKDRAPAFGFELSFPFARFDGNRAVSFQGVNYEPWHWRWVGKNKDVAGAAEARAVFATARRCFPAHPGLQSTTPPDTSNLSKCLKGDWTPPE